MSTSERFEINGHLTVDDVPDVRQFIEKLHRRVSSPDDTARVAMATHELLENAVKFSTDGSASLRVEVGNSQVTIVTRNRAKTDDLEELFQIGRELAAALDPMLFYLEQMRRPRSGGLGLGRVAAEGEMKIEVILEGEVVQIRALATLGGRAA